jgi:hypothetical protein
MHARTQTNSTLTARAAVCARARSRRNTPLHEAARNGHADVAAALLTHGADVHAKDEDGCGGRLLICATVGVRRAGRCRAGTGPLNRDRDAQMGMRATHFRTHTRIDVEFCMRLVTHTDAHTKAHARAHAHSHEELRIYDTDGRTHSPEFA